MFVFGATVVGLTVILFFGFRAEYQKMLHPLPTARDGHLMQLAVREAFGSKVRVQRVVWMDSDLPGTGAVVAVPGGIASLRGKLGIVSRGPFASYNSSDLTLDIEQRAGLMYCYKSNSVARVELLRDEFLKQNYR